MSWIVQLVTLKDPEDFIISGCFHNYYDSKQTVRGKRFPDDERVCENTYNSGESTIILTSSPMENKTSPMLY